MGVLLSGVTAAALASLEELEDIAICDMDELSLCGDLTMEVP